MFNFFKIPNIPYALTLEEWDLWEKEAKKKYPLRSWINYDLYYFFLLKKKICFDDPIYWIRSFLINKNHLLDLRGGPSPLIEDKYKYKWGYTDPSNVMVLSMYRVLKKFQEECNLYYGGIDNRVQFLLKTESESSFETTSISSKIDALQKVNKLILFFEIELPRMYSEGSDELGFDIDKIIDEKLMEAIKVRQYLWT